MALLTLPPVCAPEFHLGVMPAFFRTDHDSTVLKGPFTHSGYLALLAQQWAAWSTT